MPSCCPSDLEVVDVTRTFLAFSFNGQDCEDLNGPLTGYEYKVLRDGKETIDIIDPETTTCVCMLDMNGVSSCSVSVAAINAAGVGKHCPPVDVPLDNISE